MARYIDMRETAVAVATAFAAFGPPLIMTIAVSLISGRSAQTEQALLLEFLRAVCVMAVWWVCAIVVVANIGSLATANRLLMSAAASTAFCAIMSAAVWFIIVELFPLFAMCLIISLPTLGLAIQYARLANERAALDQRR